MFETVTGRAREYKQPRGGYIKPSEMETIKREDGIDLKDENISASIVGTVVDYMTRFIDGDTLEEAFKISLIGADRINESEKANELLKKIKGLDKYSIISACKLVGFDTVFRAGPMTYKPVEDINPDEDTINNIIIMIKRCLSFIEDYGPIVSNAMTFIGGYTPTVVSGDADFMTEDTIWDLKVTKNPIKPAHTLQILMYYIMGCRAIKLNTVYDFENRIKKIGIYNPRKNEVYTLEISKISKETIKEVETEVIGYKEGTIDPHLKSMFNKDNK